MKICQISVKFNAIVLFSGYGENYNTIIKWICIANTSYDKMVGWSSQIVICNYKLSWPLKKKYFHSGVMICTSIQNKTQICQVILVIWDRI